MVDKLGFGLAVTVICMAIVFMVLIALSYIIKIQRAIVEKLEGAVEKKHEPKAEQPKQVAVQAVQEEDEELIAVISAAVAAALGRPVSSIKVRSINAAPSWAVAGRQDQIGSRF